MNLIERAKNMIITPKTEWLAVESENQDMKSIIMSYVLPLAVVSAICAFIGYAFIGVDAVLFRMKGINWGLSQGITVLVSTMLSMIVATYVVDMLAPSFGSEKNLNRSAQLVGFSLTPGLIGGIFSIIPMLAILGGLLGLYGIYLMYIGLSPIKKTPEDKKVVYLVVSFLVIIAINFVMAAILGMILRPMLGLNMPGLGM